MQIKLKRGRLFWHVLIVGNNGEPLLTSETYYSKGNAKRAAHKLTEALRIKAK